MSVIINETSVNKFKIDGIEYFKNFTPVASGNYIKIVNTYDSRLIISDPVLYSEYIIDGNAYPNVEGAQSALLDVIYTRDSLGNGTSVVWGGITGDINNQTDLITLINNQTATGSTEKEDFITGSNVTSILLTLGDNPKAIELFEDGSYRIEDEFYSYTQGSSTIQSVITILNGNSFEGGTKVNLLKFY